MRVDFVTGEIFLYKNNFFKLISANKVTMQIKFSEKNNLFFSGEHIRKVGEEEEKSHELNIL